MSTSTTHSAAPTHGRSMSRSNRAHHDLPTRPIALVVSLVLVAIVAGVGRTWTDTGPGSWYDGLERPAWEPPGAVFGIVWTVLYIAMAVAAWRVARHADAQPRQVRVALTAYLVQLALNFGWTAVFFAAERPGWALAEISALLVAAIVTVVLFERIDRLAAWLMLPYLAWLVYATTLNAGIVALN